MNDSTKENLRELLAGFMDEDTASQTAEDIEKGDEFLRKFAAPSPGDDVVAAIKARVAVTIRQKHRITLQHRIFAAVSVAAAIVLVSALALKFFEPSPIEKTTVQYAAIPARVWDGSDITTDDADIAVLVSEVKTIENELSGVQLKDNSGVGNAAIGDLETELIEIGGDFWKG
jgi:hypothetical protein